MHNKIFSKQQLDVFFLFDRLKNLFDEYDFAMFGGTALALQIGHRKSEDFDFITHKFIDPAILVDRFRGIFKNSNVSQFLKNTLSFEYNTVKVSFFGEVKYPMLKDLVPYHHFNLYSVEDIAAMKMAVIFRRSELKDYFDLASLVKFNNFEVLQIIALFKEKFGNEASQFSDPLIIKSLTYLDDMNAGNIEILDYKDFWLKPDLKTNIKNVLQEAANKYLLQ